MHEYSNLTFCQHFFPILATTDCSSDIEPTISKSDFALLRDERQAKG
jgi:hypothetical protein